MSRPSDPLLAWLRELLQKRGINSAQLASESQLSRSRTRRILAGAEPMLLDEFLAITQALHLTPEDLAGVAELPPTEEDAGAPADSGEASEPPHLRPLPPQAVEEPESPVDAAMDPWGNQPRQLVEAGFALGCDFGLILDTSQLGQSGVPASVLERHRAGLMRIQLDAAYHRYNEPRYDDESLTLTLSFDGLYVCTFPWSAIRQIVFAPAPPEATGTDEPHEPDSSGDGRPRLRLVT